LSYQKITLLRITKSIAPVNLHSYRRSAQKHFAFTHDIRYVMLC